jgi:hypothetical protein
VVALILAFSFGSYGLCKKQAGAPAIESLTFETMVIAPFALTYVVLLSARGDANFSNHGPGHLLLFLTTGIVTAVPLICFGGAAIRVSMVTLGLLQYLAPILQFALGVVYFHEDMPAGRWIGFAWSGSRWPSSPSTRCATAGGPSASARRSLRCEGSRRFHRLRGETGASRGKQRTRSTRKGQEPRPGATHPGLGSRP